MLALLLGAAVAAPFLGPRLVAGHDSLEYPPTLVLYADRAARGDLLPAWTPYLSAGRGQPFFLFNPPALYPIAAAVHLGLGAHEARAVMLAVFALTLVAAAGAFTMGRLIAGPAGGAVAAAALLTHPYVRMDLYARAAWTEFAALAFFPWVLASMVALARTPSRRWVAVGALAWAAVGATHHPSHLILAAAAVAAALVLRSPRALLPAAWGLALSAFAWAPGLLLRHLVAVDRLEGAYFDYRSHFVALRQLLLPLGGPGYSVPGVEADAGFSLGPLHMLLAAAGAFALRRRGDAAARRAAATGLVLAAVGAFMSVEASRPVWALVPILKPLAFPWRFHLLAAVGLAAAAAGVAARPAGVPRPLFGTVAVTLAAIALLSLHLPWMRPYGTVELPRLTPAGVAARGLEGGAAAEFEPRGTPPPPEGGRRPVEPGAVLMRSAGDVRGLRVEASGGVYRWTFESETSVRCVAAAWHFPCWEADDAGRAVSVARDPATGLVAFDVGSGAHEVVLRFAPPFPTGASRLVSLLALAGLVAYAFAVDARLPGARREGPEG